MGSLRSCVWPAVFLAYTSVSMCCQTFASVRSPTLCEVSHHIFFVRVVSLDQMQLDRQFGVSGLGFSACLTMLKARVQDFHTFPHRAIAILY